MSGRSFELRLIKYKQVRRQSPNELDMKLLETLKKAYDEADVVVTKEARESWYWDPNVGTQGGWHSNSPAVFHIDFGRMPGQKPPPIAEIKEWCRIRGIPERKAYIIAKMIGRNGTPPREITRNVVRNFKNAEMTARAGQNKVL